ncbi:hypothetical protein Vadar_031189 [Vaccinium darrowii]|uniref:Uncharacterized protein n=1 Tax=Vaccinium darrowii TaxID=229202 RepID=A0ACB7Z8Q9_9ERIC|nr:hypothetical protein Vadar_031189 [Vaccinium darrowii]
MEEICVPIPQQMPLDSCFLKPHPFQMSAQPPLLSFEGPSKGDRNSRTSPIAAVACAKRSMLNGNVLRSKTEEDKTSTPFFGLWI